jgi:hypothetical protein
MPGSRTAQDRTGARCSAPVRVAFRLYESVGVPEYDYFAAQWLAYTHPCQRFVTCLAATPHA